MTIEEARKLLISAAGCLKRAGGATEEYEQVAEIVRAGGRIAKVNRWISNMAQAKLAEAAGLTDPEPK